MASDPDRSPLGRSEKPRTKGIARPGKPIEDEIVRGVEDIEIISKFPVELVEVRMAPEKAKQTAKRPEQTFPSIIDSRFYQTRKIGH
jgi:hypothetical protein